MKLLKCLDDRCFLGYDLWEFSAKSLLHRYGWVFLFRIACGHPVRTWRGLSGYRRWRKDYREGTGVILFGVGEIPPKIDGRWLVALGFCLKPVGRCPSRRFNHDCGFLKLTEASMQRTGGDKIPGLQAWTAEMSQEGGVSEGTFLHHGFLRRGFGPSLTRKKMEVCRDCQIALIGQKALVARAALYIMTSAEDVVYDLFIPRLKGEGYQWVMFFLCPYTAKVMVLSALICGMKGLIVTYSSGDCKDYEDFSKADRGAKEEQTAVSTATLERILRLFP
ncbi:MAG TPA: hypothetical protein EYP53_10825 [Candidatus Latescibacteria bacterium]|nr:hypothetical protein [Candidatus Latescibacterota bacterium]